MPDALLDIPTSSIDTRKLTIRQRLGAEDLTTLIQSIERYGVIDPIVVRPVEGGRYELVVGQRRVEACLRLGFPHPSVKPFARVRSTNEERSCCRALNTTATRRGSSASFAKTIRPSKMWRPGSTASKTGRLRTPEHP